MERIIMTAPAKINLMLDVTGKRDDGYHTLDTVMQSISLCDTVEILRNSSGAITVDCTNKSVPCGESAEKNIAFKAAMSFYGFTGISDIGLHIKIEKRIPSQAGLGGGSADGAAVIAGMNILYGTGLSYNQLFSIGVKAGADIPFCIIGGTKLCKGIGEIISPAPPLEDCFIVIGKGGVGISTAEAYKKIDRLSLSDEQNSLMYDSTLCSLKKTCGNIFETVTENKNVSKIKKICADNGAVYSAMSGSGSAVFGLFREQKEAADCSLCLKEQNFFSEVCKPLSYGAKSL